MIDFNLFENKKLEIDISPKNKTFSKLEGKIILRKSDPKHQIYDQLIFCDGQVEEIEIPSKIKEITNYAFIRCKKLHTVTFEANSSLELIGDSSFCYCDRLKNIIFPSSVKKVFNQALYGMKNLESVQFLSNKIEICN